MLKSHLAELDLIVPNSIEDMTFQEKMGGLVIAKRQKESDGKVFTLLVFGRNRLG